MCLKIYRGDFRRRTARKDIVVYKNFLLGRTHGTLVAPYFQKYSYNQLGLQQPIKLGIAEGYEVMHIREGYHSMSTSTGQVFNGTITLKCIIPKGTKYVCRKYADAWTHYVSENLIITDECTSVSTCARNHLSSYKNRWNKIKEQMKERSVY